MLINILLLAFLTMLVNPAFGVVKEKNSPISFLSTAFNKQTLIPDKYTCKGIDISPPLSWANLPKGTKSLALIVDDPDAPSMSWVHWVIYNIPPALEGLEEDIPNTEELENGITQGINDFPRIGYGGPCPPSGIHRYYFTLYALDKNLNLKSGLSKQILLKSIKGHIIDQKTLIGKYGKK